MVSTSVESENIIIAVSSAPVALTVESSVCVGVSAGVSAGCSAGCSAGATVSTVVVSCGRAVLRLDIELLANTLLTDTITKAAKAAKNTFFICVNFFIVNIIVY